MPGIVTTKATQAVGDVPVLDASLVFVERDDRVTGVRGRVFPGLTVSTDPTLPAEGAGAIAEQASAAPRRRRRRWWCCPAAPACWPGWSPWPRNGDRTTPSPRADYYIDATTGDILSVQQVTDEGRVALPWAASRRTYLHRVHLAGTDSPRRMATAAACRWPERPGLSRPPDPELGRDHRPQPDRRHAHRPRRPDRQGRRAARHHHAVVGPGRAGPAASRRTTRRRSATARSCPASSWSARTPPSATPRRWPRTR